MTCAWLLQGEHDVVLFEESDRVGGHVLTVGVGEGATRQFFELGAEFFFEEGYGGLHGLLDRLGLERRRRELSLSVTPGDGRTTFVLPPRNLAALASLVSRETLRDLHWFVRTIAEGERVVRDGDWSVTVGGLAERAGAPRDVSDRFFVPLVAANWGVTTEHARALAAVSVMSVMGIRLRHQPHSFSLSGGFATYTTALAKDCPRLDLRLKSGVRGLVRDERGLQVRTETSGERFDAVVLACDWHNSRALCAGSAPLEGWQRAFGSFESYEVDVALHRDISLMPADPRLWEASNLFLSRESKPRNTVWSGKPTGTGIFRTWLRPGEPDPRGTIETRHYRHISVTPEHRQRQAALARLQGSHGVWAAGMYTDGIDNHESAIRSAVTVAKRLSPEGERVRYLSRCLSA